MLLSKRDFHKRTFASQARHKEREYWLDKLSGCSDKAAFPYDCGGNSEHEAGTETFYYQFPDRLAGLLEKISNHSDPRLHVILMVGVSTLLYKYTGQQDLLLGTPIFEREDIPYINTILPVRVQVNGHMSFKNLLLDARQVLTEAEKNKNYPIEVLAMELRPLALKENHSLFDTGVSLNTIQNSSFLFPFYPALVFDFSKTDQTIAVTIRYCASRYRRHTIIQLANHLEQLLFCALSDVSLAIKDISLLPEKEKDQIIFGFNNTSITYPQDKTVLDLVEESVKKTPKHTALICDGKRVTYEALKQRMDALAYLFSNQYKIKSEDRIGLMVSRSENMVLGLLGILKSGAAFVPIDADYPQDRIKYMIADSQIKLLLTEKTFIKKSGELPVTLVLQEEADSLGPHVDVTTFQVEIKPKSLAYIIYTSGSTGKPKGVMIEHRSLVDYVQTFTDFFTLTEEDTVIQQASVSFDTAIEEIFPVLCVSGQLLVLREGGRDIEALLEAIESEKVSLLSTTPLVLNELNKQAERLKNLRTIISGGDTLKASHINYVCENTSIYNTYGPTESTVCATYHQLNSLEECAIIGKPIANRKVFVVDETYQLLPIGIPGQIAIGGSGLARGYLNNDSLTSQQFVNLPFLPDEKLYLTGDIGKWCADGSLKFIGRTDHQVKIHGYRVETGEIENTLQTYPGIKEVIVVAKNVGEEKSLCAYVVALTKLDFSHIRSYLLNKLPVYMVPTYFVELPSFRHTQHGKIDLKALPEPKFKIVSAYVKPQNEVEQYLVDIWSHVLHVEKSLIGIDTDFFELDGNSIKAAKIIGAIQKNIELRVSFSSFFNNSTIRRLAAFITGVEKRSCFKTIVKSQEKAYYPASSEQKRMFVLNQVEEGIKYNFPLILKLEGKLDKSRLEEAFIKLISRHESLRTSFELADGGLVQKIHESVDFKVKYFNPTNENLNRIPKDFFQRFDLSKAPVIRVGLIEQSGENHMLMIDLHHIAADGISLGILINDLSKLYKGETLPLLPFQYKDYAVWKEEEQNSAQKRAQEEFWVKQFSEEVQMLQLPTDYPRPPIQRFNGDIVLFEIDKAVTTKLNAFARQQEVTLFMVLLSAYATLLYCYTEQEDMVIGTPVAGRTQHGLEHLVGMFANTLALRCQPAAAKPFIKLLTEIKATTLDAFENQDFQFDELVDKLRLKRDLSRNPLFDTMLSFQNVESQNLELGDLKISVLPFDQKTSIFDLTIEIEEVNDYLKGCIQYCTGLFREGTIITLKNHFLMVLEQILLTPEMPVQRIKDQLSFLHQNNQ